MTYDESGSLVYLGNVDYISPDRRIGSNFLINISINKRYRLFNIRTNIKSINNHSTNSKSKVESIFNLSFTTGSL